MSRASPSMVRSMSSTAIGASLTICWVTLIAVWKLPKWQAPTARRQLELDAVGEAERALRPDQNMRQIDVVPARRQRVEIVAADPALHLRKADLDRAGFARAQRHQVLRQRLERRAVGNVGEIGG